MDEKQRAELKKAWEDAQYANFRLSAVTAELYQARAELEILKYEVNAIREPARTNFAAELARIRKLTSDLDTKRAAVRSELVEIGVEAKAEYNDLRMITDT